MDWVKHWHEMVEAREAQDRRLREKAALPILNLWDQRAGRFRRSIQERPHADRLLELVSSYLIPESTVLDVGAGVGRHALPLARMAKRVIAVEVSQGMRRLLETDATAQGLTNLDVVASSWEEAHVEPCDIAICSHVVYRVLNIENFIKKLKAHANRYCFIAVRTAPGDNRLWELWKRVHGEERCREPGFIELYNALYQSFGVCANVEVGPARIGPGVLTSYEKPEDALAYLRGQMLLPEGTPEESWLRDYLKEQLVKHKDGFTLRGNTAAEAILWWNNQPGSLNFANRSQN